MITMRQVPFFRLQSLVKLTLIKGNVELVFPLLKTFKMDANKRYSLSFSSHPLVGKSSQLGAASDIRPKKIKYKKAMKGKSSSILSKASILQEAEALLREPLFSWETMDCSVLKAVSLFSSLPFSNALLFPNTQRSFSWNRPDF
jgi:hypothetical protein